MEYLRVIGDSSYRGYPVNVGLPARNRLYCYKEILDAIIDRVEYMASCYSKVFVLRFDLRFRDSFYETRADEVKDNRYIKKFFKKLVRKLTTVPPKSGKNSAHRGHKNIAYVWVREYSQQKKVHYHCFLAVSGHKVNKPGLVAEGTGLMGLVQRTWEQVVGGISESDVWQVSAPRGGKLDVNKVFHVDSTTREWVDKEQAGKMIYALSYLAKVNTKDRDTQRGRLFSGSQMRPKAATQPR